MNLQFIRNLAFWTFLILYLVVTPLISLHALGFVIDPKTLHFVKTGIISITSAPKEADVFVNAKCYGHKTPVAVTGLLPGDYEVKIVAPAFQDVDLRLKVFAEEVTKIDHLLLVPKTLSIQAPVLSSAEFLIRPDDAKYLFLISRDDQAIVINAFDLRRKKLVSILRYDQGQTETVRAVQVSVSEDEKKALIKLKGNLKDEYVLASLSSENETMMLSKLISESIANVRFNPKNSREVFYLAGKELNSIELEAGAKKKTLFKDVRSFEVVDEVIYIFTNDFRLLSANLQGKETQNLLPDRGLYKILFGEDERNSYRMFLTGRRTAFWLRQDGVLVTNRLPHFIDENVKGVQLVQDSEKLLYWKTNELWMIDMESLTAREQSFFEKGPMRKLIFTANKPIVSAQMIRSGHQVVLATDKEFILIQTEPNLELKQFPLIKHRMKERVSFTVDEVSGDFYWIDRKDDGAMQIQKSALFEGSIFPFSIRFKKPFSSESEVYL